MQYLIAIATQNIQRDIFAVILGLCVGSFLNVLALRTLAEVPFLQTFFGFSQCPKCKHRLGVMDLVPLLSFVMLNGKCRYCKQSISWQYPVVEIVTAIAFIAVLYHYQIPMTETWGQGLFNTVCMDVAMITFFCILIAVCVTDFKEKLIPHEITYPAIVIGIAFSAFGRDDVMPSLAGVGISYVLFDFLAFYGLKLYYYTHQDEEADEELERAARAHDKDTLATLPKSTAEKKAQANSSSSSDAANFFASPNSTTSTTAPSEQAVDAAEDTAAVVSSALKEPVVDTTREKEGKKESEKGSAQDQPAPSAPFGGAHKNGVNGNNTNLDNADLDEEDFYDPQIDETFAIERAPKEEEEEDFEVMGGGDAVLAGLIAAWIGLANLGITLLFGFMFGSLLGSVYVAIELHRRGALNTALKETALITGGLLLLGEGTVLFFAYYSGLLTTPGYHEQLMQLPWIALGAAAIFGGILIGTIRSGRDASKPFPFGPALAAGAVVAVFMDPTKALQLGQSATQFGVFLRDMGHN